MEKAVLNKSAKTDQQKEQHKSGNQVPSPGWAG